MFTPINRHQWITYAFISVTCLLSIRNSLNAQSIGIGTATPNSSAKVDIQATDKGILIPRMTTFQRATIPSPATGLLVYQDGSNNIAVGSGAFALNDHGDGNIAIGYSALDRNRDGNNNSALGDHADVGGTSLSNATAIGASSRVDCSDCLVLGSVNGINGGTANVNVGIGTTSPTSRLDVNGTTKSTQLQVGGGSVMGMIQSGTSTVGPNGSGLLTVTLIFPTAFASAPKVIATIRGGNFNDTFAVSTRSITNTQVVFNIQRVDINGSWAQNLQLDWIAIR